LSENGLGIVREKEKREREESYDGFVGACVTRDVRNSRFENWEEAESILVVLAY